MEKFKFMINFWTQKGKIFAYMQKNPNTIVEAIDFMSFLNTKPFVWYSSSARLSELKSKWLIECVWHRDWLFNSVMRRNKTINLYKITSKGLKCNLI